MRWLRVALFLAILSLIFISSLVKISDVDTMIYLASGKYIIQNGLPKTCIFIYSLDTCPPIAYPEWLLHVILFTLYSIGSWNALSLFQAGIIIAMYFAILLHGLETKVNWHVLALGIILSLLIGIERFFLRADLIGLMLAVLMYVLLKHVNGNYNQINRKMKIIFTAAILLLQWLWANMHGSFPIGFIIIFSFLFPLFLNTLWKSITLNTNFFAKVPNLKVLGLILAGSIIVSFLNPYGFKSFSWPIINVIDTTESKIFKTHIAEYESPFNMKDFIRLPVKYYKLLIVGSIALLFLNLKKLKLEDLLLYLPLAILSLSAIRYIVVLGAFAALILPQYLQATLTFLKNHLEPAERMHKLSKIISFGLTVMILIIILRLDISLVTNELFMNNRFNRRFGLGLTEIVFPQQAVDFVLKNDLKGNMFNSYNPGGYLIWTLYPKYKTYIHGATIDLDLEPTIKLYRDYLKINQALIPHQEIASRLNINFFFIDIREQISFPLITKLYSDKKNWRLVYFDPFAMIFVAAKDENKKIIDKFEIDLNNWQSAENELKKISRDPKDLFIYHNNYAVIISLLQYKDKAITELKKAIAYYPDDFIDYMNLGFLYKNLNELTLAENNLQKSVTMRPDYTLSHIFLGDALLENGKINQAIKEYQIALKLNHRLPNANYKIADIYEAQGDLVKTEEYLKRELAVQPNAQNVRDKLKFLKL